MLLYRIVLQKRTYEKLEKDFSVGSTIEGTISNMNEYALYVNLNNFEIDDLHANDLSYTGSPEEELKNLKRRKTQS